MELEQSVCTLKDFVDALEEERRKIEVFQRELPLCMLLVINAIESCKKQMIMAESGDAHSDWEVASNRGPVLEEFIPLKRSCSSVVEDGERPCKYHSADESFAGIEKPADWLKSVQLWTHDNDQTSFKQEGRSIIEPNKSNGAFHPFCREDMVGIKPAAPTATTASSTTDSGGPASYEKTARPQAAERKTRRCWSPELHRRFLQALELLGGSRAATPKQIKDLMKVDGLTNDEVKSHLQKYRLNNRRPSQGVHESESVGDVQVTAPQFVVVGGIWVPPAEHPHAMSMPVINAESGGQTTKVYTPTPRLPNGRRPEVEAHNKGNGAAAASSGESPATSTSSRV